jgi:adenine-specific DNA methylase
MNRYPRRLIEVDLPIKRISVHARREKSIRHGHISTLHIWWARRPLAACRAVILASLWPDPAPGPDDPPCPAAFLAAAGTWMTAWATMHAEKASAESFPRLKSIQDNPTMLVERPMELRNALLDFIADFAKWDNSTDKNYLETSRALVQAAHEALGGAPGTRPLVVDPFAGGGAIPFEALRIGADAFASDLNPVPILLNKVVLEYVPKHGQRLVEYVRQIGAEIKERAECELGKFYPGNGGETPIAYFWARTVLSEAPGQGDTAIEVPLLSSMWLCKKERRKHALRWVRASDGKVKTRVATVAYADRSVRKVRQPLLELFQPTSLRDVEPGTSLGGAASCPVSAFTTPVENVRAQLTARRGGASDARLISVATSRNGHPGRFYRMATEEDEAAARAAGAELKRRLEAHSRELPLIPDGQLNHLRGFFNVVLYGMARWGDMFSLRQALAVATLVRMVEEAGRRLATECDPHFATAVQTCLALAVDRQAEKLSSVARWDVSRENPQGTFGRQALPMVWDFCEVNPFSGSGGDWDTALDWVVRVLETTAIATEGPIGTGHVERASATAHPLPNDSAQAIVTDPPYYAAVPYADLSDFFYSWLRRSLFGRHDDLLVPALAPKEEEIVSLSHRAAMYREKDNAWFEKKMGLACGEGRRICNPSGVGVYVFASKETPAWEAMLTALVDAGWVVTASWPIDTEMGSRLRARNSATLASSVHIVCRPRENPDGSVRTDEVGDWRDVLAELPLRIHDWMPRLAAEGVVGADAIFACLGPALEIFSRYSRVEKASGEAVPLKEYLEQVWAAVSTAALSMIFDDADAAGLEPDARLTAMWLWTVGSPKSSGGQSAADDDENEADDEGEESDGKQKAAVKGFSLEFDAARKIAQGLGIHLDRSPSIVEVKGDTARLLPVAGRTPYLFGKDTPGASSPTRPRRTKQRKLFEELEAVEAAAIGTGMAGGITSRPRAGQTALDRVHQAMILFGANRGEALKQFLVDDGVGRDGRFWKLAQALSALYPSSTDEKRWVDGVLARKKGLGF